MSNQFYKYITSLLVNYFKQSKIKRGDRFYLQLDNQEDVLSLVSALKNIDSTKSFKYKHKFGDEYITFAIPFQSVDLVVTYTSKEVKPDFLVTLRNLVGEQIGIWENTALISIVSEQLDSIQGGSSDLQKEGMPLHPSFICNILENQIKNSALVKVDRIILLDYLANLIKEQVFNQITFFEFQDIFTTLQKGGIEDKEYYKFGLFKDPDLSKFKGKEQNERLNENRDLFEFVRAVHDFGLGEEELEKKFSSEGKKELIGEKWRELLFPKVYKFHEDYNNQIKNKKVKLTSLKVLENLKYWDKPQKESAAGKRKRHIVIFNPEEKKEVHLQASFNLIGNDKSLSSRFVRIPNGLVENIEVNVKYTNIIAKIFTKENKPTFARFSYKHDNKATLGAEFFIVVLPIDPLYLDRYKSTYTIDPTNGDIKLQYENGELSFGDGIDVNREELSHEDQQVSVSEGEKLIIIPLTEAFNEKEELRVTIQFDRVPVPVILKNELPETTPITGQRIWKLIRETNKDIQWIKENNRLVLGNRDFYFYSEYRTYFEWEYTWVDDGLKYAKHESDHLFPDDLQLSDDLREAYSRFINYFKTYNSIPSLCTITDQLKERSLEYLRIYIRDIKSFKNGYPPGRQGRDLFKLGTIHSNGTIYFTPFHPLMVAFKLKVYELLQTEEVDKHILKRISPDALIPFIYDEKEVLYKPDHQQKAVEWLIFKPVNKVSVSEANQFLAKVVNEKISQFKEHFMYLFIEKSQAPLQINIMNISNDKEIIRGIFQWVLTELKNGGANSIKPIVVTIYRDGDYESSFDLYSKIEKVSQFEDLFDIKLESKELKLELDLDAEDILRIIREKLFFYKKEINTELRYAHITFYKMHAQEEYAIQLINKMTSGIAIEGLYSSVPSMRDKENYKSGFGTKAYQINDDDYLINTAYFVNELAANLRNGGNDSYQKGTAIFSRTTTADETTLERIFNSSYWVTFVDPSVDLDFFNKYDRNLVVIHYSDQYTSSSRIDAITVTDKSQQYFSVIREFLEKKEVKGTEFNVLNTIKAFNTFNGEWLLRIIGSKGHYDREKLSIISAIKYSVSYFDHPNILWIPISLEEILRVAGAIKKSDGVFTAKNLGVKGSHSDDLLLIGLENIDNKIHLYFYPIEVKIGVNNNDVLDKAKIQVLKTKKLLFNTLSGEMGETFTGKFYRNFFVQLLIANAKKLDQSDFWKEKGYCLSDKVIEKLLKDEYIVSNELTQFIGEGAILSFQKNAHHRSAKLDDDNVYLLNLTERDGYEGLVIPIKEMKHWIQDEPNDFLKEDMLSYQYDVVYQKIQIKRSIHTKNKIETNSEEKRDKEIVSKENGLNNMKIVAKTEGGEFLESNNVLISNNDTKPQIERSLYENIFQTKEVNNHNSQPIDAVLTKPLLEDVRIRIGKAENSNREIYWEYGSKGLANRHLLISGKSGQGKTYFMQCLLLEKSKLGIPSIVIDYTEGFLPNQLEPEFVQFLGDKLKQKIVFHDKLPINPFQKNVRDIGGIQLPESNTDIAERIKSVFAAVYKSLGIQQQNAIYEAVLKGLEQFNKQMNLNRLKEILEKESSSYAKTALSQIRPLIDRNPFRIENTINWEDIIESNGEIYIIQLTGFPRDVQLIITEFILWDLWNYSVRYGNKNKPISVIMDEAQNLDHTEKSPSARILTEGRKFGWSAWYATQFLKSQLTADELARLQMSSQRVYFSPPEQELSNIATSLTIDTQQKKYWENKLASLKKGQCIVHGPVMLENGEMSNPVVTVVDIISLFKRI